MFINKYFKLTIEHWVFFNMWYGIKLTWKEKLKKKFSNNTYNALLTNLYLTLVSKHVFLQTRFFLYKQEKNLI